ncbi:XdhC family protein [Oleomonas cavernae]|uniref:XdhC family protein n=1 Tax=Oleomonas cavernae TaxID=2320859 RepID=A0A418WIJ9_9PROT|nr:XdhC family protein [Oleomonas cavernae]RJF89825.1 XdhC family protein [Oleomonas cavernae]
MTTPDVLDLMHDLQARETPFAVATVVRTASVTAAKAGAKALILGDGTVAAGWVGGGCARGATLSAAREALADGCPRLVSIQPDDMLHEIGVRNGETRDGVRYAHNMCPSQGTMDIFVEPVLPRPQLVVLGASPVARVLVATAGQFGFRVTAAAPARSHGELAAADHLIDGFDLPPSSGPRFLVVSTQSAGDLAALTAAVAGKAPYLAFVGSRRKIASLLEDLRGAGIAEESLAAIKAPAGLDIGAVTPEEIALSILAEVIAIRRRGPLPQPSQQKKDTN